MLNTTEEVNRDTPVVRIPYTSVKKPSVFIAASKLCYSAVNPPRAMVPVAGLYVPLVVVEHKGKYYIADGNSRAWWLVNIREGLDECKIQCWVLTRHDKKAISSKTTPLLDSWRRGRITHEELIAELERLHKASNIRLDKKSGIKIFSSR